MNITHLQNRVAYGRDHAAYKDLFFYFHPLLLRFVCSIVKSTDVAEDIVSETMVKVWTMGEKLVYVNDLHVYLFKCAKNAALNHIKSLATRHEQLNGIHEAKLVTSVNDSAEKLQLTEIKNRIEEIVTALPSQCQLVYRLIKEQGLSYRQVTAILEISQNTIETHMRLALKRLRSSLSDYLLCKK